jgi:hypothetical protein
MVEGKRERFKCLGHNYMMIPKHLFGSSVTASKFSRKVLGTGRGFIYLQWSYTLLADM